jgi:hypothetical protein
LSHLLQLLSEYLRNGEDLSHSSAFGDRCKHEIAPSGDFSEPRAPGPALPTYNNCLVVPMFSRKMFSRRTHSRKMLCRKMFPRKPNRAVLAVIVAAFCFAAPLLAQRGGISTGPPPRGGTIGQRPDGVSEGDDLRAFHHAMAVQATPEQRAAFAKIAEYAEQANVQLQNFHKSLPSSGEFADRVAELDQSILKARTGSQNFLTSFSSAQKSGLQETTKRFERADVELDRQLKTLDQFAHSSKPEIQTVDGSAAALDRAFAIFQNEEMALGREMSILFDPTQGETFSLPRVTNAIPLGGETISIPESGAVVSPASFDKGATETNSLATRSDAAPMDGKLYRLKLVADLSDLQLNATALLRPDVTRLPRCGERITLQQATIRPISPASLLVANFHVERWVCQGSPMEVSDSEATLEIKLTPAIDANGFHLTPEITRVEAEGLLRQSLRADLGATLRDEIASSLTSALARSTDLKTTLPPVAQPSATLQKAAFQDEGADQMSLVLDGQLHFSDEQAQQFAAQLKQRLAAQGPVVQ